MESGRAVTRITAVACSNEDNLIMSFLTFSILIASHCIQNKIKILKWLQNLFFRLIFHYLTVYPTWQPHQISDTP